MERLRWEGASGASPVTCSEQGHLEPFVQECVQAALGYLQRWRLYNFPAQPVPQLRLPHSTKKKNKGQQNKTNPNNNSKSSCSNGISCISICTHCFWPFHWEPLRRVWLCLLYSIPSGITHSNRFFIKGIKFTGTIGANKVHTYWHICISTCFPLLTDVWYCYYCPGV